MIKPYLMTGAAILALGCFSPVASAQSEPGGGQGAGRTTEQGAGAGAAERGGSKAGSGGSESKGAASQSHKSAQGSERSSSGSHKSSANGQAAGESGKGKSAEAGDQRGSDRGDKAGKSRADKSDKGDTDKMKSKSAEERGVKEKDRSKSAEKNRDNDKSKRADRDHDGKTGKQAGEEKGMDRDKSRQAQDRDRLDQNKQAQDRDRNERNKQAGNERAGQKQGRVSFSDEQRTRFRETIKKQNVRNEKVNVNVSIGVRLPRDRVRLHALPAAFISVAPDYRRYRYALIEDRYCIVDPDTYEIVYIIDEGGGGLHRGGGQTASLDLSAHEREIVLRHVDWDRRADINIDLALGADIPDRVTLIDFPSPVINEVPKLRGYRYVVLEKRVAIVDPQDREVLLVIRD